MKKLLETKPKQSATARRLRFGCVGLLLVLALAVMAEARFASENFATITSDGSVADEQLPGSSWWWVKLKAYQTQCEFLFFPANGAGARLDFAEDD